MNDIIPSSMDDNGGDVAVYYHHAINTLAVNRDGSLVALGGKKGLYLVELDQPKDPKKILSQQTKSEITSLEWNPHASKHSFIASAANHFTMIWDVVNPEPLLATIQSHSRVVSDLAWSPFNPDLLATISNDTYINLWDVREPKKSYRYQHFFAKTAGATQVKWNRHNENLLASSHEGEVRIWDLRSSWKPLTFITAHGQQIQGIDWSRTSEKDLLTCSQDKQVKLWSISKPRKCEAALQTGAPVLRARFVPFGDGVLTMAQKEDCSLRLWTLTNLRFPVHSFSGHSEPVRAFDFRITDDNTHQIVSWGKDQYLRIWHINSEHIRACQNTSRDEITFENFTPQNPTPKREVDNTEVPQFANLNLSQEFQMVRKNLQGLDIKTNDVKRTCVVQLHTNNVVIKLRITFPSLYPNNAAPSFTFLDQTTISTHAKTKLRKKLLNIALMNVENNRPCLQQCLLALLPDDQEPNGELFEIEGLDENLIPGNSSLPIQLKSSDSLPSLDGRNNSPSHKRSRSASLLKTIEPSDVPSLKQNSIATDTVNPPSLALPTGISSAKNIPTISSTPILRISPRARRSDDIPCPRLSSVCFAPNGTIFYFHNQDLRPSPRTYKQLKTVSYSFRAQTNEKLLLPDPFSDYLMEEPPTDYNSRSPRTHSTSAPVPVVHTTTPVVVLKDLSSYMSVNQTLAKLYKVQGNLPDILKHNATIAYIARRRDLVQMWSMLLLITDTSVYNPHPGYRPDRTPRKPERSESMSAMTGDSNETNSNQNNLPPSPPPPPPPPFLRNRQRSSSGSTVSTNQPNLPLFLKSNTISIPAMNHKDSSFTPPPPPPLPSSRGKVNDSKFAGGTITQSPKLLEISWLHHPFGKRLVESIFRHYSALKDVQTLAIISCLLSNYRPFSTKSYASFEYYSPPPPPLSSPAFYTYRTNRIAINSDPNLSIGEGKGLQESLLSSESSVSYECYRALYADILLRWGENERACEILKFSSRPKPPEPGTCTQCSQKIQAGFCLRCKYNVLICSICRLPVRGCCAVCLRCGHGGHLQHISDWVASQTVCPTGCGCSCIYQ